ncbi:MAG: hypothetical protein R3F18_06810 [Lysobacterales bacterium]
MVALDQLYYPSEQEHLRGRCRKVGCWDSPAAMTDFWWMPSAWTRRWLRSRRAGGRIGAVASWPKVARSKQGG